MWQCLWFLFPGKNFSQLLTYGMLTSYLSYTYFFPRGTLILGLLEGHYFSEAPVRRHVVFSVSLGEATPGEYEPGKT